MKIHTTERIITKQIIINKHHNKQTTRKTSDGAKQQNSKQQHSKQKHR